MLNSTGPPTAGPPVLIPDRPHPVATCFHYALRAYIVAGRPARQKRLASFEGWSDSVRSALAWLGKEDPVKSMETVMADDPDRVELREMLTAWADAIGTGHGSRLALRDVIAKANAVQGQGPNEPLTLKWPELSAAVNAVAGGFRQIDLNRFGNWMRHHKEKIIGGMYFASETNTKGTKWFVMRTVGVDVGQDEVDEETF
jgi:hypothetical protein